MKALSVMQPWAELIRTGRKTIELRTWSTSHRGDLLVCAGKRFDPRGAHHLVDGPRGVQASLVRLVDVRPAVMGDANAAGVTPELMRSLLDDAETAGRTLFAWCLDDARDVPRRPVRGALGLFNVPECASHLASSKHNAKNARGHAVLQRRLF